VPAWYALPLLVAGGFVLLAVLLGPGVHRMVLAFLAGMAAALSVILAVDDIRRG
jgi:hypothetical protein